MATTTPLPSHTFRRDFYVIALIGVAHGVSHFFQLVLPPLFPLIKAEFDVSYTQLGLLMTVFYIVSGIGQAMAGFFVDRFGALRVLLIGMLLFVLGGVSGGLTSHYLGLFLVATLLGLGNCVFHPADFSILNHTVSHTRMGHAFSTHGISGSLGYAAAPIVMLASGAVFGWRVALLLSASVGAVMMLVLWRCRTLLDWHPEPETALQDHATHAITGITTETTTASSAPQAAVAMSSMALFFNVPIFSCFVFFAAISMAAVGLQNFLPSMLVAQYQVGTLLAASALTAYLLGSAFGIFVGGFAASHSEHHERIAAGGMLGGALLLVLLASDVLPSGLLVGVITLTGFMIGITNPSRDMLVRKSTPPGATGRVYGFVYSGLDLGSALGPAIIGASLDHGRPDVGFAIAAIALSVNIWMAMQNLAGRQRRARQGV